MLNMKFWLNTRQPKRILPPLLNRNTRHNHVHIWARGPAEPPCRLFNLYADMYKKNRSTKAGHENPKKPAGGKKHGERVPPSKAVVQPLGF